MYIRIFSFWTDFPITHFLADYIAANTFCRPHCLQCMYIIRTAAGNGNVKLGFPFSFQLKSHVNLPFLVVAMTINAGQSFRNSYYMLNNRIHGCRVGIIDNRGNRMRCWADRFRSAKLVGPGKKVAEWQKRATGSIIKNRFPLQNVQTWYDTW